MKFNKKKKQFVKNVILEHILNDLLMSSDNQRFFIRHMQNVFALCAGQNKLNCLGFELRTIPFRACKRTYKCTENG